MSSPMAITRDIFLSVLNWVESNSSLWVDTGMALLGLFLFQCALQKGTNRGPMLWPVLGIIPSTIFHMNDMYNWCTQALIRSGGTFPYKGLWMGGSYGVVTSDPTNIEYMLSTRFKNYPKGDYMRERFLDLLGDGIFNVDNEAWKEQRRLATVEMHSSRFVEHSVRTLVGLVHDKLVKVVDKVVLSGEVMDLQEVLLRFTFDNICVVALGVDPGCLRADLPHVPFSRAFEEATELSITRFLFPPFVWKPMRFFGLGYERRLKEAIKIVHEFANETVLERRKEFGLGLGLGLGFGDRHDLLSRLVEMQENDRGREFSDKFLRDFCVSFILAGRDTTSVALAWFFWLIHKNPMVEEKILSEIREVMRDQDHQSARDLVFTVAEIKKMRYLHAALSEALRLHPPVPMEIKEVREDDVFPDGRVLRKGARVMCSLISMARMESIWGRDCLEYKPERWIGRDGEFIGESQYKYAVFNAGPRLCIGKKFAYMQMKMVVASMLWRYRVEVLEGQEVVPKVTTTLYMKNGLMVRFKPREVLGA